MNALVLVSHPKTTSFNHAIAERICNTLADEGHHVHYHDLYAEHFQPVLENEEIQRRFSFDDYFVQYSRELRDADGIVFIYPDWWGMPPAILKGWIDRLFRPGTAYEYEGEEFMPKEKSPMLAGKRAMVLVTTNETNPLTQEAPMLIWKERILEFVGIKHVCFKVFYDVRGSTGRQRKEWLAEAERLAQRWW